MTPANRPSTLAKIKTRDSVTQAVDSIYVTASKLALAPLGAAQSTLKLTTNIGFQGKCMDSLVHNEEEEVECHTPKSEEHKIRPPVLCCPPAPLKPRSNLIKRKLPNLQTIVKESTVAYKHIYVKEFKGLQALAGGLVADLLMKWR